MNGNNNTNAPVHCGSLFTWEGTKGYAHDADFDHDVANAEGEFMVRSHRTGNIRLFRWVSDELVGGRIRSTTYSDDRHTVTIYTH